MIFEMGHGIGIRIGTRVRPGIGIGVGLGIGSGIGYETPSGSMQVRAIIWTEIITGAESLSLSNKHELDDCSAFYAALGSTNLVHMGGLFSIITWFEGVITYSRFLVHYITNP
jgi:hypothetical protein